MSVVELWLAFTAKFREEQCLPGRKAIDYPLPSETLLTPIEQEDFEERAAIMEFDSNLTREEAEHQALRIILTKKNLN